MIQVSIKVRSGAAHFDVVVRAESIERAVSLVRGRHRGSEVTVKSPIDPAGFFVEEPAARVRIAA